MPVSYDYSGRLIYWLVGSVFLLRSLSRWPPHPNQLHAPTKPSIRPLLLLHDHDAHCKTSLRQHVVRAYVTTEFTRTPDSTVNAHTYVHALLFLLYVCYSKNSRFGGVEKLSRTTMALIVSRSRQSPACLKVGLPFSAISAQRLLTVFRRFVQFFSLWWRGALEL